ncbi:DNA-methyltransferase [Ferrovum myxofaciens]|jgi:site-specific DNA-methyltransferase (adenine-specific)|uniref:Methyltransferase n=3 Tax=root TaxID=1 RepID=A0A859A5T3_9PROT|nr:site-specific DNA-methyltransferase [Ferrovum myxofaciens]KXW58005.1 modification methylase DpnIIB [Ferrovum myxofaciens]MBU6993599.1 site-specific DNA-methyltransferase [Ferrovum myxofaciens]QKE37533.1 MAG: site-specific DNA-methyltransferase [Ferrovum myxofaciens]QWY75183.1 MAG: site-specific DNA-methyltransferase [Ferrovum myxofaciens]QWY77916.1 MAG: site-specific DNA-methyltransferase [Ferrovum myxofaciens]
MSLDSLLDHGLPFNPALNQESRNSLAEKPHEPTLEVRSVPKATITQQDVLMFLRTLPAESIDLIITDPAYSGMNQHLLLGRGRIVGNYQEKGENRWFEEFHDTPENYGQFLSECKRVLKNDRHLFLMFDSFSMLSLGAMVRDFFNVKNIITWDKVNIGMGHYFRRQTEFILFASKGKRPVTRRDIPDIWKIKRLYRASYPTQKPVELFEAMVASSKAKSDTDFVVCDPFVGSGSSAIAALRQGSHFVGCDTSEKAVSLSRKRVDAFLKTGMDIEQEKPAFDEAIQKKFW